MAYELTQNSLSFANIFTKTLYSEKILKSYRNFCEVGHLQK
jgi:hypothetical protein